MPNPNVTYQLAKAGLTVDDLLSLIGNTALTTTAQTLTGAINELDGDISSISGTLFPVGAVVCTNSNNAPSLPGTWSLIDKQFASKTDTLTATAGRKISDVTLNVEWQGDTITLWGSFTTSASFSPSYSSTNADVGTISLSDLGVSSLSAFVDTFASASSNTRLGWVRLFTDGTLRMIKTSDNSAIVASQTLNFSLSVTAKNKLDANCDKFYWKRTA